MNKQTMPLPSWSSVYRKDRQQNRVQHNETNINMEEAAET